jgi:hypothetical protein
MRRLVILFCLSCLSCKREPPVCGDGLHVKRQEFVFDVNELDRAWQNNDSLYLKQWVFHLEEQSFRSFADKVTSFATSTNFCFGFFDLGVDLNHKYTDRQKMAMMYNAIKVNKTYLSSCLFLNKKIIFDSTLFIQNNYWNDSTLFNDTDIELIKNEMERFCK